MVINAEPACIKRRNIRIKRDVIYVSLIPTALARMETLIKMPKSVNERCLWIQAEAGSAHLLLFSVPA